MVNLNLSANMSFWPKSPAQRVSRQESTMSGMSHYSSVTVGGGRGMTEVPSDESDPGCTPSKRQRVRRKHFIRKSTTVPTPNQRQFNFSNLDNSRDVSGGSDNSSTPSVSSPVGGLIDEDTTSRRPSIASQLDLNKDETFNAMSRLNDNQHFQAHHSTTPHTAQTRHRRATATQITKSTAKKISGSPSPVKCNEVIDLSKLLRQNSNTNGKWTILSMWVPAMEDNLRCDEETLVSVKHEDLLRKIVEIAEFADIPGSNVLGKDFNDHHLTTLQVRDLDEGSNEIVAEVCAFKDTIHVSTRKEPAIKLNLKDPTVRKLLFTVSSRRDIIVILIPCCNSGRTDRFLIHLTSRKYNMQELGVNVIREASSHYQFINCGATHNVLGRYNIIKIFEKVPSVRTGEAQVSDGVSAAPAAANTAASSDNCNVPENSVGSRSDNNGANAASLMDVDPPVVADTGLNFYLERFRKEGRILPGPMRPKVSKGKSYIYDKLLELQQRINEIIRKEEVETKRVLTGVLPTQCYVYGVVTNLAIENHEDSYEIRITDDSLAASKSVLVRLCMHLKISGPTIRVGDIIRIHRLTAQLEFDKDVQRTTMVLSTSQHQNYVIFRHSPEDELKFEYLTCANSITLTDFDNLRVGELHAFKLGRANTVEKAIDDLIGDVRDCFPETHQQNLLTEESTNSKRSYLNGIHGSELDSPALSEMSDSCYDTAKDSEVTSDRCGLMSEDSFATARNHTPIASPNPTDLQTGLSSMCALESQRVTSVPVNSQQMSLRSNAQNQKTSISAGQKTYTCFMHLNKKKSNPTLLCKIDLLGFNEAKQIWHLIISDGEGTLPPDEFINVNHVGYEYIGKDKARSRLIIDITNAKKFLARKIFNELYNSCNTEELYIVNNVQIKGTKPPYSLEVDGATCEIRYPVDGDYFDINQTFTQSQVENSNAPSDKNSVSDPRLSGNSEEFEDADVTILEEDSTASQREKLPNGGVIIAIASNSGVKGKKKTPPTSDDVTNTKNTKSKEHKTGVEPWTGLFPGRRQPRKHYQSESTFKC